MKHIIAVVLSLEHPETLNGAGVVIAIRRLYPYPWLQSLHRMLRTASSDDLWGGSSTFTGKVDVADTLSASLTGKYSMAPPESTHRRSKAAHFGGSLKNVPTKPLHDPLISLSIPGSIGRQTLSQWRTPSTVLSLLV
jgi:hypothetical protein